MPILHKNIIAETDIHVPKWMPSANEGDYAWKNELGELESTDELVLPAALDFVDASVAPPTTNTGDIYVLSSGGSVNAGWGSVALDDWVRYDGSAWNSITPQKSTLCYDEDTDKLYAYDGTDWQQVGGDSIYTASGTVPTSVVATLTDTLRFDNVGSTSTNLVEFKQSGNANNLPFLAFYSNNELQKTTLHFAGNSTKFRIEHNSLNVADFNYDDTYFYGTASGRIRFSTDASGCDNWQLRAERQGFGNGFSLRNETTTNYAFHVNKSNDVMLRAFAPVGSEEISLQGDTMMGNTTDSITFYGGTLTAKQTITGSRAGNAALADLLTKLANLGLITDSTTA